MSERHLYQPDYAPPPGALIQEILDVQDISGRELARRCGRSAKLIAEIISGKASIEPETAIQLERVTEHSAVIWMGLESNYRLHLARQKEDAALVPHTEWAKTFPLKELAKRDLIDLPKEGPAIVREILQFFGCGSIEACRERFVELQAVAYRHSPSFTSDDAALLAWLRIGDLRAENIATEEFDRAAFLNALKKIRSLTRESIDVFRPQIQELCAAAGVVFVLEKALSKVALSGVSRWLTPRRALIQQTARHLSNDHFWFTFFHECAHLLLHSRKQIFLDGKGMSNVAAELESEANDWASNFLIPSEELTRFITRFDGSSGEVIDFAEKQGIAPGIVVGQLQYRRVLSHAHMSSLKQRYIWAD